MQNVTGSSFEIEFDGAVLPCSLDADGFFECTPQEQSYDLAGTILSASLLFSGGMVSDTEMEVFMRVEPSYLVMDGHVVCFQIWVQIALSMPQDRALLISESLIIETR